MNRVNRLLVAAAMCLAVAPALPAETVLQAVRVKGNGPILDVESAMWKQAKPIKVTMLPQTVATPNNPKPAVSELKVRAVHNG